MLKALPLPRGESIVSFGITRASSSSGHLVSGSFPADCCDDLQFSFYPDGQTSCHFWMQCKHTHKHTHKKRRILLNALGAERRANALPTGPALQPCGWIPLKAKRGQRYLCCTLPLTMLVFQYCICRLLHSTRFLWVLRRSFIAWWYFRFFVFLCLSLSLSPSFSPLLSGFGSNQASFICALSRISNVVSYDWLPQPHLPCLYFFYFYSFLLTYSRWMCSPTNRFCIETLSGHLQCVPRQRPAARQGCAPAGRFQWRHRWCPAAWAALHRWFWRPSLSVREISPKYCEEKSEEKFSLNDSLHKSKLLQNLTIKFANSSSDHPRT